MESRLTVLHVDDDPSCLRLADRRLDRKRDGMRLVTATTAAEAFSLLDDRRVDCVVSDSMRTADGDSFVAAVRRRHPELPVVLFTGAEWEQVADGARQAGVAAYVQKGTDASFSTLVDRLDELVGDTASVEPGPTLDPAADSPLGDDWAVVATHDWQADRELVVTLVDAVDRLLGPGDVPTPLYDAINGEALEDLLRHGRGRDGPTLVRFPYRGLDFAVTSGGLVAVKRPADAVENEDEAVREGEEDGVGERADD